MLECMQGALRAGAGCCSPGASIYTQRFKFRLVSMARAPTCHLSPALRTIMLLRVLQCQLLQPLARTFPMEWDQGQCGIPLCWANINKLWFRNHWTLFSGFATMNLSPDPPSVPLSLHQVIGSNYGFISILEMIREEDLSGPCKLEGSQFPNRAAASEILWSIC